MNTTSPFALLHDPSAALAAHAAMPAGEQHKHLTDDPETKEEIAAEKERRRSAEYNRRKREARLRAWQSI